MSTANFGKSFHQLIETEEDFAEQPFLSTWESAMRRSIAPGLAEFAAPHPTSPFDYRSRLKKSLGRGCRVAARLVTAQ